MKTSITEASVLLCNHLNRLFLSKGHQVRVLIEHEKADEGLECKGTENCICDIRDPLQVRGSARGLEVFIDAASDTSVGSNHCERVRCVNIRGTQYLIEKGCAQV